MQLNVVDIRYFKQWILLDKIIKIRNLVYSIRLQRWQFCNFLSVNIFKSAGEGLYFSFPILNIVLSVKLLPCKQILQKQTFLFFFYLIKVETKKAIVVKLLLIFTAHRNFNIHCSSPPLDLLIPFTNPPPLLFTTECALSCVTNPNNILILIFSKLF